MNKKFLQNIKIGNRNISTSSVNSLTFKNDVNFLINYIKKDSKISNIDEKITKSIIDSENINNIKLSAYYFICEKLYKMFNIDNKIIEDLTKIYSNIIIKDKNIIEPLKLAHSRFRNFDISYTISKNMYDNKIELDFSKSMYFQLLKHLLRCSNFCYERLKYPDDLSQNIVNELLIIFYSDTTTIYEKMEISDIFLNSGYKQIGNDLLNIVRRIETIEIKKQYTVFDDTQNVHNTTINDSVKKSSQYLIQIIDDVKIILKNINTILNLYDDDNSIFTTLLNKVFYKDNKKLLNDRISELDKKLLYELLYRDDYYSLGLDYNKIKDDIDLEEIKIELCRINNKKTKSIENVINRIEIEMTIFETFSLYDLFSAIWKFIVLHKNSEDLKIRLIEEISEMDGYCTTGHLSRLINTIQGFTDIDKLQVKIADKDQIKSSITKYLSKELEKAPEYILDNMLEQDKSKFYNYVSEIINKNFKVWYNDYKHDFLKYIVEILQDYTKYDKYKIKDMKIII